MEKKPKSKSRFAELFKTGEYDYERIRSGEVKEAVILSIGERDLVVDLGAKRDGIVHWSSKSMSCMWNNTITPIPPKWARKSPSPASTISKGHQLSQCLQSSKKI